MQPAFRADEGLRGRVPPSLWSMTEVFAPAPAGAAAAASAVATAGAPASPAPGGSGGSSGGGGNGSICGGNGGCAGGGAGIAGAAPLSPPAKSPAGAQSGGGAVAAGCCLACGRSKLGSASKRKARDSFGVSLREKCHVRPNIAHELAKGLEGVKIRSPPPSPKPEGSTLRKRRLQSRSPSFDAPGRFAVPTVARSPSATCMLCHGEAEDTERWDGAVPRQPFDDTDMFQFCARAGAQAQDQHPEERDGCVLMQIQDDTDCSGGTEVAPMAHGSHGFAGGGAGTEPVRSSAFVSMPVPANIFPPSPQLALRRHNSCPPPMRDGLPRRVAQLRQEADLTDCTRRHMARKKMRRIAPY